MTVHRLPSRDLSSCDTHAHTHTPHTPHTASQPTHLCSTFTLLICLTSAARAHDFKIAQMPQESQLKHFFVRARYAVSTCARARTHARTHTHTHTHTLTIT